MTIKVRLLIGAHAYACVEHGARKTDIRLSPGKAAWTSLRESADEYRAEATHKAQLAALCEQAAHILESEARPMPPITAYDPTVADRHMAVIEEAILHYRTPDVLDIPLSETDQDDLRGIPTTLPTRFDPFPMSELQVEAALCLWEAALELKEQASADGTLLTALFELHGTGVMRHAVMQLVPACCAAWDMLSDDEQEKAAPFDWEYVPGFLRRCITDGRLEQAIANQYTTVPAEIR